MTNHDIRATTANGNDAAIRVGKTSTAVFRDHSGATNESRERPLAVTHCQLKAIIAAIPNTRMGRLSLRSSRRRDHSQKIAGNKST